MATATDGKDIKKEAAWAVLLGIMSGAIGEYAANKGMALMAQKGTEFVKKVIAERYTHEDVRGNLLTDLATMSAKGGEEAGSARVFHARLIEAEGKYLEENMARLFSGVPRNEQTGWSTVIKYMAALPPEMFWPSIDVFTDDDLAQAWGKIIKRIREKGVVSKAERDELRKLVSTDWKALSEQGLAVADYAAGTLAKGVGFAADFLGAFTGNSKNKKEVFNGR